MQTNYHWGLAPGILCNVFDVSKIENIYIEATRCKSQIIPGRSFPRRKSELSQALWKQKSNPLAIITEYN